MLAGARLMRKFFVRGKMLLRSAYFFQSIYANLRWWWAAYPGKPSNSNLTLKTHLRWRQQNTHLGHGQRNLCRVPRKWFAAFVQVHQMHPSMLRRWVNKPVLGANYKIIPFWTQKISGAYCSDVFQHESQKCKFENLLKIWSFILG